MKKIAMAAVAVVMVLTMLVTATAAQDNFINSVAQVDVPEIQGNPEIAQGIFLLVTPYAERATLPDKGAQMEEAYKQIKGASTVAELNEELAALAKELGLSAGDLVVSDLFDLSLIYSAGNFVLDPETLAKYMPVTTSVKVDLLDRFVGLLHYVDGKWELIKSADVKEGKYLNFTTDSLDQFAIVVYRDGVTPASESGDVTPDSPETGDVQPWGFAVLMAVSGLLGCLLFVRRKETAE